MARLRSGDTAEAVAKARRAYALAPASAAVSQAYGMALAAEGKQRRAALSLLTKARAIGGEAPALSKMGGSDWAAATGKADAALTWEGLRAQLAAQGLKLRHLRGSTWSKQP